jgi:two-component system, response regulator PdtaR
MNNQRSASALHGVTEVDYQLSSLDKKHVSNHHHRAKHRVMIVDSDAFAGIDYEDLVRAAGYSVAEFFFDNVSAGKWLSTHTPGAAIIEVRLGDKSCVALAQKLAERKIPFLVVSRHSADWPGVDRIVRPVPWCEKPITSAGLRLALGRAL